MLRQKHVKSKRKRRKKQCNKDQETEKLSSPARHIKAVVKAAPAPGWHMVFPKLCLHMGEQFLVILMKFRSFLRNTLLHALILCLFPLGPGFL